MIETISGQGGDLLSSVEAGRLFGYTNDYVARLARKGKVRAVRIDREWLVDRESLGQFVIEAETAKRKYAERIREERRREFRAAARSRRRLMLERAYPRQRGFVPVQGIIFAAIGVLLGSSLFATASLLDAPWAVGPQKQGQSAPSISKGYWGLARTITYTSDEMAEASATARFRLHLPSLSLPVLPEIDVRAAVGTAFLELSDGLRFAMRELWCDAASLFKDDACVDASTPAAPEPVFDEPPAPVPAPVPVSTPIPTPAPAPTPTYTTVAGDTHITNITTPTTIVREYHEIEVEREPRVLRVLFNGQVEQIYDDMQAGFKDIGKSIDEGFGSIETSFETELLTVSGDASLGGTLSVAGAATFSSTLQVSGAATLATLTVIDSTTTNATTTNFYTTTARGTDLAFTNADFGSLVADAATSTDLFATRAIFGSATSTNFIATNATTTNFYTSVFNTDTASIAALTVSEFIATSATSTNLFVSNFVASAATTTDFFTTRLSVDSLSLSSGITSHFVPSANDTYDLGSPSFYWRNGYIDTITVNSISAASTSIGGTASESFTINSDNATTDTEDMSLIFYRGAVVPNAVISWNSTTDRFEFNQPAYISNQSGSTTASTLTLQGVPGQTGDIFRIASSTGNTVFGVAYDGAVTISTSTIAALTAGTTTVTNLAVTNTSTSTFAGGLSTARLGVSGAATFDSLLSLSGSGANIALGGNWLSGDGDDEGVTIDASGQVGIGTVPEAGIRVAVGGDARFRGSVMINGNGVDHPILYMDQNAGPTTVQLNTNGDSYLTGGNLGIGTDSPSVRLDVQGDAYIGGNFTATGTLTVAGLTSSGTSTATYFAAATLGTAGAPAFTFASDVNTGIWSPGADTLALSTGGVERLTVTSAGNLGIGTSTPADVMTIERNTNASNALTLINTSGGTAAAAGVRLFNDTSSGLASLRTFGTGYTGVASWQDSFVINTAAGLSGGIKLQSTTGGITLSTTGLEGNDFVVAATGNVGIGTTTPNAKLFVASAGGNSIIDGNLPVQISTGGSGTHAYYGANANGGYGLLIGYSNTGSIGGPSYTGSVIRAVDSNPLYFFINNTTAAMTINSSGNIGIGTTNPLSKLAVTNGDLLFTGSTHSGDADFSFFNNGVAFADANSNGQSSALITGTLTGTWGGNLQFATRADGGGAGVERMRITSAGNVGIGTTNPTEVNASARLTVAGTGAQLVVASTTDNTTSSVGGFSAFANTTNFQMLAHGSARVVSRYGLTLGGWDELTSFNNPAGTSNGLILGVQAASPIVFGTTNLERMRIDAAGNVGIGTTTPSTKLNVNFSSSEPSLAYHANSGISFDNASNQELVFGYQPSGSFASWMQARTWANSAGVLAVNPLGGNVGIGTTAPLSTLNVAGTTGLTWTAGGNSSGLVTLGTGGTSGSSLWVNTPSLNTIFHSGFAVDGSYTNPGGIGDSIVNLKAYGVNSAGGYGSVLTFSTSNNATLSERMRIDKSGNVGIGTTTPQGKLSVQSAATSALDLDFANAVYAQRFTRNGQLIASIYKSTSSNLTFDSNAAQSTLGGFTFNTDGGNFLIPSGNVGIGTASPGYKLEVQGGSIYATKSDASFARIGLANTTRNWSISNYGTDFAPNGGFVIADETAGAVRLTINTSGNVGIGTSTPNQKLDVYGSIPFIKVENSNGGQYSGAGIRLLAHGALANQASTHLYSGILDGSTSQGYFSIEQWSANAAYVRTLAFYDYQNQSWDFSTNGSPRLKIDSSGNVGIGNTSPNGLLTVGTNGTPTGRQLTVGTWLDSSSSSGGWGFMGGNAYLNSAAGTFHYSNTHASIGAVGFATNYPSWNDASVIGSNSAASTGGGAFTPLIVATFKNTGNVGIGTTTPATKLFVSGTGQTGIAVQGSTQSLSYYYRADGNLAYSLGRSLNNDNAHDFFLYDNTNGATRMTIGSTGNMTVYGSGTTCVIGSGTGATNCTSDARLKTNVAQISGDEALQKLSLIQGVTFNWLDPSKDQQQRVGVIAQDVQAVFPQVVGQATTTLNGVEGSYLTVDYAALVSPIISAINALFSKVNALASVVAGFADSFTTNRICVGSTCITETELKALLEDRDVDVSTNDDDPTANGDAPVSSGDTPTPDSSDQAPSDIGAMDGGAEEPEVDASTTEIEPSMEEPGDVDQDTPPEAPPEEAPPADPDPAPETAGGE